MDKIKQANPILQALGNARTSHTYNSSRVGKYFELSFTKNGDLLGGNITTYLLENVRVVNQLPGDRNFHIFYQLMAGASEMEKRLWALSNVDEYHYANQGKASQVPSIDDEKDYLELKQAFFGLDFDPEAVTQVLQLVAGLLHIGNINFRGVQEREGEVAHIIENIAGDGTGARAASRARRAMQRSASAKQKALAAANAEDAEAEIAAQAAALDLDGDEEGGGGDDDDEGEGEQETVLEAAARLCCFPLEELKDTLTMRSVELNREVFRKHLTPVQAANARDAVAKAIYKHLFDWIVNELNKKLMPTDDIATEVHSGVGILDIFGFDAFETNSFEQLLINYANESLQQQFNHHMFKLEIAEYTQEGISFEDITFPDNQESLDLISLGVFKTLDDQCRIPNPSDKRFAAAIYKDCKKFKKFSVSFAEESQDQFSISHFAGKVSYRYAAVTIELHFTTHVCNIMKTYMHNFHSYHSFFLSPAILSAPLCLAHIHSALIGVRSPNAVRISSSRRTWTSCPRTPWCCCPTPPTPHWAPLLPRHNKPPNSRPKLPLPRVLVRGAGRSAEALHTEMPRPVWWHSSATS